MFIICNVLFSYHAFLKDDPVFRIKSQIKLIYFSIHKLFIRPLFKKIFKIKVLHINWK